MGAAATPHERRHPVVVLIDARVAPAHRAVGHHDYEYRTPFAGVDEKAAVSLEHGVEKGIAATVSGKRVDGLVQLFAVGCGWNADTNLAACGDQRDLGCAW